MVLTSLSFLLKKNNEYTPQEARFLFQEGIEILSNVSKRIADYYEKGHTLDDLINEKGSIPYAELHTDKSVERNIHRGGRF